MPKVRIVAIGLVVLALAVLLAFRLSPWPSVAIITYGFSSGERQSEAALARHVPPGIETFRNLAYGPGEQEVFDLYRTAGVGPAQPAIVWVHGGAWIAGTKDGVANYLKVLAGRGYITIAVEYSTGYGARYPKPVEQVNRALGHIFRNADKLGIDPDRVILAGDSAGAQIAAQVALINTDPAYADALAISPLLDPGGIRALLLLSGAYDMSRIDPDGEHGWFIRTVLWAYTGKRDFMQDPHFQLASIVAHAGPGFPPSFISSGNADPLAPQAERLAAKLQKSGVPVETLFFPAGRKPELPHEYQFNLDEPAGRQALERMLGFAGKWTEEEQAGASRQRP